MRNVSRQLGVLIWSVLLVGAAVTYGAEVSADAVTSMLYLTDGDYFSGSVRDCSTANVLRWQTDAATGPFEFKAEAIRSAYFASPQKRPAPVGEYCIELSDGDVLFGSLTAINKEAVEVNSATFGHLKIARAEVHRLATTKPISAEFRGPNGLAGWLSDNIGQWREEAGRLVTNKRGAIIKTGIAIPDQAHIEFEISWSKSPQFTLAFSEYDGVEGKEGGYRFEVWGRKLVLVRELEHAADVAVVSELDSLSGRVHLEALYNAPTGEFRVQSLDGRQLAKIVLPNVENPLRYVSLKNSGVDVCLEQLVVTHWKGHSPTPVDETKPRVHKNDGSVVYGDVVGYEPDKKQFVVKSGEQESRVDSSLVDCVVLKPSERFVPTSFRVGLDDGTRFSGDLAKVAGETLYLQRRGIDRPLACAIKNVRSLVNLNRDTRSAPSTQHRTGRLESKGILSHGTLVAASPTSGAQATCLAWKPRWSTTPSTLRADVSGRIVYRDPPPPPKPDEKDESSQQPAQRRGIFWDVITSAFGGSAPARQMQMASGSGTLCLLTGDRIPCESMQIDEEGIHFTSATVASDFVPHRAVKALEFVSNWTAAALAEVKRTRLLTLPRMQKGNPPTHLVVSTAGDFLRCRLNSMNADSLAVEARLENKKLSRSRVACIIWLHDLDGAKPASPPANPPPTGLQLQAVQSDGIRLTFVPQECDGTLLAGASDILGACRVRLTAVDQLILGPMIRENAQGQAYGGWKLHDAIEPEFAHEGADGSKSANLGAGSILLGKPAPDFQLELLNGGQFKLSEQKHTVVVLDFWASWCGQCIQIMPEMKKLGEEFKGREVKFISVNMQEDQATIKSVLERMKIQPTVALDIDGVAGERYQVSAIPHIVVIDRESKIAELSIGAGPGYIDQLRTAIQKSLEPKKAK